MRAGLMDKQVTVEQPSRTVDATYGTEVIEWVPLIYATGSPQIAAKFRANVADILPSRGENVVHQIEIGRVVTRIRMRWRNDITSDMRITVHGPTDVVYQIISGPVELDGRKSMIEMLCERYGV